MPALPSLFGFAPGVVCHAVSVAGPAVRSYRTFSPLPRPKRRRFVFCGTVPGVAPAGRYPAPYVDGARTFLSRILSAVAGAAVRPTDALGMGAPGRRVKPITARGRIPSRHQDEKGRYRQLHQSLAPCEMPNRLPAIRRFASIVSTASVKINYPEDVVLRVARSTGCRRMAPVKQELARCSIC